MKLRKALASTLAVPFLTLTACGSGPDENTNDEDHIKGMDKATAFSLCKKDVEKKLKSPSTADFQSVLSAQIVQSEDKNQWSVRTHVDSENSFGAKVRSEIVCTIQPEGPDKGKVQSLVQ